MLVSVLYRRQQHRTPLCLQAVPVGPSFKPLPDDTSKNNFSHRENTNIYFTENKVISAQIRDETFSFRQCYITINQETSFTSNMGFGFSSQLGSGGAIFTVNSVLLVEGTTETSSVKFTQNSALAGGSISGIDTDSRIKFAQFSQDIAYYQSGSVQFVQKGISIAQYDRNVPSGTNEVVVQQGKAHTANPLNLSTADMTDSHPCTVTLREVSFTGCTSKEFYGAASFSMISDLYIQLVTFQSCVAGHSGGALGLTNTMASLLSCRFLDNLCGRPYFAKTADSITPDASGFKLESEGSRVFGQFSTKNRKLLIPKGGAAIFVMTTIATPQATSPDFLQIPNIELSTQKCCFFNNRVYEAAVISSANEINIGRNGKAHTNVSELLFAGQCYYRSYQDFWTFHSENSISEAPNDRLRKCMSMDCGLTKQIIDEVQAKTFCAVPADTTTISTRNYESTNPLISDEKPLENEKTDPVPEGTHVITTPPTPYVITTKSITNKIPTQEPNGFDSFEKIQSMTPTRSETATASTYGAQPEGGDKTRTIITNYPFIYSPSQSSTASVTSTGASWPIQSATDYAGSPTASTASNDGAIPMRSLSTMTPSKWGEIPHPSPTVSISFVGVPSQSLTRSVTSTGATWPNQTYSPIVLLPDRTIYGYTPLRTISTVTASRWGEIPNPSATASISHNYEPSRSKFKTPSESPTMSKWDPNQGYTFTSKTAVVVNSVTVFTTYTLDVSILTFTETFRWVDVVSYTNDGERPIIVPSFIPTIGELTTLSWTVAPLPSLIPSISYQDQIFVHINLPNKPNGMPLWLLIVIAVASIVVIAIIATIIWWLYPKGKSSSSHHGENEMQEETVVQVQDSSTAPVTQDNPLWTSNVLNDTDDPFRKDFEEDTNNIISTTTL